MPPDRAAPSLPAVAERVADRLRVVGPRMAARSSAEATGLLDDVRAVLQQLADLAADAERSPHRTVPLLAAHALADQTLVLAHDVEVCGDPTAVVGATLALQQLARRI
jgi:hypothetical protein